MHAIDFPAPQEACHEHLRREVRDFLSVELAARRPRDRARTWTGFDAEFSRKLGQRGWIGMTWPKRYGGHERSALERYVVLEEMLAAGAPVAAHWIADRQSGPLLLKVGTEQQRQTILPKIAAGECFFCIGMSEPDVGSDLANVRTRAVVDNDGFRVTGTKLWTTYAHESHCMILFCRTGRQEERQAGTSQFLVDLSMPGITIRPIVDMSGEAHFNEVTFADVHLPASALIGGLGCGWEQVMGEFAFERSGPDRFLSSFVLLVELVRALSRSPSERAMIAVGRLVAHICTLRRMSQSVAYMLQKGENPMLQAAVVKDLGAVLEQEILFRCEAVPAKSYAALLHVVSGSADGMRRALADAFTNREAAGRPQRRTVSAALLAWPGGRATEDLGWPSWHRPFVLAFAGLLLGKDRFSAYVMSHASSANTRYVLGLATLNHRT